MLKAIQNILYTNDWIDVMNVRTPYPDTKQRTHAYGLALDIQNSILDKMSNLVPEMKVIGKGTLLPLQRGIIQSNNAVKLLLESIEERFDMNYILTYRLNQDVLEKFFGVVRSKGGLHDHPDRQEFKHRLQSYILGYNEGVLSKNANVAVDDTPDLDCSLTGTILKSISINPESISLQNRDDNELESIAHDGLENLAGYICHKLSQQFPNKRVDPSDDSSFTWLNHLNEGLSKPTAALMTQMEELEAIFERVNREDLLISNDFLKKILNLADNEKGVKNLFLELECTLGLEN